MEKDGITIIADGTQERSLGNPLSGAARVGNLSAGKHPEE
jgi:hypothetical protein